MARGPSDSPPALARVVLSSELRGLLRDRRALFAGVILPVLLYPLMFLFSGKLESLGRSTLAQREVTIACDLSRLESGLKAELERRLSALEATHLVPYDASYWYGIELALHEGRQEAVDGELRQARAVLEQGYQALLIGGPHPVLPIRPLLRVCHADSDEASDEAYRRLRGVLRTLRAELRETGLSERLGADDPGRLYLPTIVDVASEGAAKGAYLGRLLPVIAILAVISAGAYAALSTFAGEREAQTLETLLVQPVPARDIALGKYASVVLVALCALVLNLVSFQTSVSLGWLAIPGAANAASSAGASGAEWLRLGWAFLVAVPAALFLCALLVLASARARTFREGQQLLFPLTMASAIPAGVAGSVDVALDPWTALLPVFGPSLALRDALRGSVSGFSFVLCAAAQLGWTALCLRALPRVLDAERIFSTTSTEEEQTQRQVQSRSALMWGLFGVIATYMIGGWVQARAPILGLVLTLWLLLPGVAWLCARGVARRAREGLASVLALRPARASLLVGAVLVAPGLAFAMREWIHWQQKLLPLPARAQEGSEFLLELSLPLLLALVAVSPAVGEELLFRGAVLGGLRRDQKPFKALLVQALLFAAAHASIHRFLPTLFVGFCAGWLRLRSDSLYVAMAFHATYNAWVVTAERYETMRDPAWAALAVAGLLLLLPRRSTAPSATKESD